MDPHEAHRATDRLEGWGSIWLQIKPTELQTDWKGGSAWLPMKPTGPQPHWRGGVQCDSPWNLQNHRQTWGVGVSVAPHEAHRTTVTLEGWGSVWLPMKPTGPQPHWRGGGQCCSPWNPQDHSHTGGVGVRVVPMKPHTHQTGLVWIPREPARPPTSWGSQCWSPWILHHHRHTGGFVMTIGCHGVLVKKVGIYFLFVVFQTWKHLWIYIVHWEFSFVVRNTNVKMLRIYRFYHNFTMMKTFDQHHQKKSLQKCKHDWFELL